MNRSRKIVILAAFGLTFIGAAFGDTLSESCTGIGPSGSDFVAGAVACNQFNVAGATLNSITVTVTGSETGSITLTNNNDTNDTSATGTITTIYSLDSALTGFAFSAPLFQIALAVGPAPIVAGGTLSNTALSGSNSAGPLVNSNSSTFGGYSGGSFFDIFVDTNSGFGTFVSPSGNGTNTTATESDAVSAGATVVFDYTPGIPATAPEPGTALFLGFGLTFVLFGARRRKA